MKYTVKIADETFTVEIADLNARPVVAVIDGESFEVWPENGSAAPVVRQPALAAPATAVTPLPAAAPIVASSSLSGKTVKAPLPGVIVAVMVKPGDEVKVGQELCTIEAMKMKNAIRATRAGVIGALHATVGQTVNHSDPLISFAE
jgi:glutaconyl-CoA/methylmalonyl-CoA decarboxylase subunit gamma